MQHEVYNTNSQARFPSYALLIHRLLILDVSLVCGRWSYSSATLGRLVLTQFWNEKTTYGRRSIPRVRVQVDIPISKVGTDLRAGNRQVGIVGWRPIIGADYSPVAIMELTNEDDALLLIASENVHVELRRDWSEVHEINQFRGQYGEYHPLLPQLKADGERVFQYFRMDIEMFAYIWGKFNTAWSRIGVTIIHRRFLQKNVL